MEVIMKKMITAGYMFITLLNTVNVLASQIDVDDTFEEDAELFPIPISLTKKEIQIIKQELQEKINEYKTALKVTNPQFFTSQLEHFEPLFEKHTSFKSWESLTQEQAQKIINNVLLSLNDNDQLDQIIFRKKVENKYTSPEEIIALLLTSENMKIFEMLYIWVNDADLFEIFKKTEQAKEKEFFDEFEIIKTENQQES